MGHFHPFPFFVKFYQRVGPILSQAIGMLQHLMDSTPRGIYWAYLCARARALNLPRQTPETWLEDLNEVKEDRMEMNGISWLCAYVIIYKFNILMDGWIGWLIG